MIDIHCHLLPNISDGPKDPEKSLQMLREAAACGITDLSATCHYEAGIEAKLAEKLEIYVPLAKELGVNLTGAIEYTFADLEEVEEVKTVDEAGNFFLLDFNTSSLPYSYPDILSKFKQKGLTALVVHPEKLFRLEIIKEVYALRDFGAIFILNAASFFESQYKKVCWDMIYSGNIRGISSDAHGPSNGWRPSEMAKCRNMLAKRCGSNYADMLFRVNPGRILRGEMPMPCNEWLKLGLVDRMRMAFSGWLM